MAAHDESVSYIQAASMEADTWQPDSPPAAPPMQNGSPLESHDSYQQGCPDMRDYVSEALMDLFNENELKDRQQEVNSINDLLLGSGCHVSSISKSFESAADEL